MATADRTKHDIVLGLDLDGVCADFYGAMREIAAEYLDRPIAELTPEPSFGLEEWGIAAMGGYVHLHHFAVTQRALFANVQPVPGAAAAIRRLSASGVRIRIITHRLFYERFHRIAIDQTVEWLDRHGFPYWDLCFMKDKTAVAADIVIDDAPHNVRDLRAAGRTCICFGNSTNRDIAEPRTVGWPATEALVQQLIAERRAAVRTTL